MQTRGGGGITSEKWNNTVASIVKLNSVQLILPTETLWSVNIDMLSHEVSFLHLKEVVNAYYRSYYSKKVARKKPD